MKLPLLDPGVPYVIKQLWLPKLFLTLAACCPRWWDGPSKDISILNPKTLQITVFEICFGFFF